MLDMKDATILVYATVLWMFGVLGCEVTHNVIGREMLTAGGSSGQAGTANSIARASGGAVPGSTIKFLWIPKDPSNQVFQVGLEGARAKADELSAGGALRVEVVYDENAPDSATDAEGQAEIVRSAIDLHLSGVAVSCNSANGLKDAIDEVAAAGIPVMTFDSDSPDSQRFTYLGVNNKAGGVLAAKILGTAMGKSAERKKVAVVSGVKGTANLDARVDGFLETIHADFPDLVPFDEAAYCDDKEEIAATLIEGLIENNADLGGIFFVGLWPLYLCEGTDCSQKMPRWSSAAKKGTIKTVAFDTLAFELDFVKEGLIAGLVGQRYWGWGSESVQMLYDRLVRNQQFLEWTDSGIDVVCANNLGEMEKMWKLERLTPQLSDCVINGVTIR